MVNIKCISENIKQLRNKKELTQLELAEKLKVSRSVVAKWENNLVTPDISSLLKLSATFDISIDHIVGNNNLLKNLKDLYPTKSHKLDEEVIDLVNYIMTYPKFKNELYRLKYLSVSKQRSLHRLLSNIIDQYEKI